MSKWILALALACFACLVRAQVNVTGRVADGKGRPLRGVSIGIRDSYDGATTDSLGQFRFSTTEKGKKILEATTIGFRPFQLEIELASTDLALDIVMKEEISELKAVVISAGTFEASDKKRGPY